MSDLTSIEDDRDWEFLRISQQLENVRPEAVQSNRFGGIWIVNPTRSVDIRSPFISFSRESFITLRRQNCGHHANSRVYQTVRHAVELRIEKLSDLATGVDFKLSDHVYQRVGHAGRRRQERLRKALQAYSWRTRVEFLHASRERSGRWQAMNGHLGGRGHPFAEFDAAIIELLSKVIDDEQKTRNQRKSIFLSVDKNHKPNYRTIKSSLIIKNDMNNIHDLLDYLTFVSFFGAFNACDIYSEYDDLRNALDVIAFLGQINIGMIKPSCFHAYRFLCFMQN